MEAKSTYHLQNVFLTWLVWRLTIIIDEAEYVLPGKAKEQYNMFKMYII